MELSNYEIPSLRRETESKELEKMQLQLHKEEITLFLQKIVDKIGDEMEKIFSEYLTEELRDPRRTMKKTLFERQFKDLKRLFLSIDNAL